MVAPIRICKKTLTGRIRGRRTWLNKILMQVEIRYDEINPWPTQDGTDSPVLGTYYKWRDAKVDDMMAQIYSSPEKI